MHHELDTEEEEEQSPNTSIDSAYFSSPGEPPSRRAATEAILLTRERSATWTASLRSFLQRQRNIPQSRATPSVVPPPRGCNSSVGDLETPEELDQFLTEVWERDAVGEGKYAQKISQLKAFYHSKIAEIAQREATYISELTYFDDTTPLLTADELASEDGMKQVLLESKVGQKFDSLRLKVKQEVSQTVLHLRTQLADTGRKRRKLRPKATKALSQWFEENVAHPYPSEAEKSRLALQCDITIDQVTTWFSNKRHRSKNGASLRKRNRLS